MTNTIGIIIANINIINILIIIINIININTHY